MTAGAPPGILGWLSVLGAAIIGAEGGKTIASQRHYASTSFPRFKFQQAS
jgi:hypothetical protein